MRSRVQFPSILGVLRIRRARDHAGAGPDSHVYEINTWLWNFGRPQPRVRGLSVARTDGIRRKSRSEFDSEISQRVGDQAGPQACCWRNMTCVYQVFSCAIKLLINNSFWWTMTCRPPWQLSVHARSELWWQFQFIFGCNKAIILEIGESRNIPCIWMKYT